MVILPNSSPRKTEMKYAELIRAALDGKELQYRCRANSSMPWGPWRDCGDHVRLTIANMAAEYTTMDYRLAPPPPPPDVVRLRHFSSPNEKCGLVYFTPDLAYVMQHPYEKITWDGATGEVKSVELIK